MKKVLQVLMVLLSFIFFAKAQDLKVDPLLVLFDPTPAGDRSDKEEIKVKNESDKKILIGDVAIVGGDEEEFDIVDEDCEGEVLKEGEECTIEVRFEPESKGLKFSAVKFESASYGGGTDLDFTENFALLAGFATEESNLNVEPDSYEFKNMKVGDEESIVVVLRNEGTETIEVKDFEIKTLKVGGIISTDEDEFEIDEDGGNRPCGTLEPELDPGESCTIEITFKPKDDGYKLAALLFETDEDGSPTTGIVLYGDVEEDDDNGDDGILGGCSVGSATFLPAYLLIPVLIAFRRLRK